MRRSEINAILAEARAFIAAHGMALPPFADWSPETFAANHAEAAHLVAARCGWDVTDYGTGRFAQVGLVLFTLRNGRLADLRAGRGMCYAEKLLILRAGQLCPMHTHRLKVEDIINRGGATLAVELFATGPDGGPDPDAPGTVLRDGIAHRFAPGVVLRLGPGESVTLMPGDWHAFRAEGGDVLVGEVSTVNDDETDNIFREPLGRFPEIEEDTAPTHLLVSDYATRLR